MSVAVAELIRTRIYCQDTEQVSINTVHHRVQGTTGASVTYDEIATAIDAAWAGAVKDLLSNVASYRGVGVQSVSSIAPEIERYASAGAGVGTAGAVGLPRQTAGLLSFSTGFAGPSQRGRMYLPFPAADDNQALGKPTAGYLTRGAALGTLVVSVLNVVGGAGTASLVMGILHRGDPHAVPPLPPTFTGVQDFDTKTVWATQRRRGSEGRPNVSPV